MFTFVTLDGLKMFTVVTLGSWLNSKSSQSSDWTGGTLNEDCSQSIVTLDGRYFFKSKCSQDNGYLLFH